jgi:DNA mismatch repair protein MSH5
VGEMIDRTIDFEQSKARQRTAVAIGVDADLDERKRTYDGIASILADVAADIHQSVPEWARKYIIECAFYPQMGFLTAVTLNADSGKGNYEGEGLEGDIWESMFVYEHKVLYKNGRMRVLDAHYGDMYCNIGGKSSKQSHYLPSS